MEDRKIRLLLYISILLILTSITYNIFQDYIDKNVVDYLKRRLYYERVISKKDIQLHRARYWKKIK